MEEKVQALTNLDSHERRCGDFTALFAELERVDTVAPIESGLMLLLGTINAAKRERRGRY